MWSEKDIERAYRTGDVIIKEGDSGREMFIIQKGAVDVLKGGVALATLGRGDFFGEMSILEGLKRSATVVAREETRLLVLNAGSFLMKIRKDPTFAFTIMQSLSGRVRALNEKLLSRTGGMRPEADTIEAETEFMKKP